MTDITKTEMTLEETKKLIETRSDSPFPWRIESEEDYFRSLVDANNTYIELEDLYDYMQALEREVERLTATKDGAYAERNKLVAALSNMFPSKLGRHVGEDWEDDWRNIVFIGTREGQLSWHIHDSELPLFKHLKFDPDIKWDGHTTEEKYKRLAKVWRDYD